MKRIVAAIVLTISILGISLYGQNVTTRCVETIQNTMREIDENLSVGQTETALEQSKAFLTQWDSIHQDMCLFLQHAHLDSLESVFSVLPYYIEAGNVSLARSECKIILSKTEHILKTEQITLENLL